MESMLMLVTNIVVSLIFTMLSEPTVKPSVAQFEMQTGIAATDNMNTFGRK